MSDQSFDRKCFGIAHLLVLRSDKSERRGLVEAPNNELNIRLRREFDGLALHKITAGVCERERLLKGEVCEMERCRVAVRVGTEIARHVFDQLATRSF